MEIVKQTSPFIRKQTSTTRIMIDVLIALLPVAAFAVFKFGSEALIRIVISVVSMIGVEILAIGFIGREKEAGTFGQKFCSRYKHLKANNFLAPAVSGVIYAMLVPSQIEIFPLVVGAILGMGLGKMIFGGFGQNIFNPAVVGRIIIGLGYGQSFIYHQTNALSTGATPLGGTLTFAQRLNEFTFMEMFTGNIPGSMGEICKIAILLGAAYLIFRRAADFRVMLGVLGSFIVMMFFAGLAQYPDETFKYLLHAILSGGILFGAVFMATDPVTSPVSAPGRILYGVLIGLVTALIRVFGSYPEGMAFAIFICNFITPLIDYTKTNNKYTWKYAVTLGVIVLGFIPVFYFLAGGGL